MWQAPACLALRCSRGVQAGDEPRACPLHTSKLPTYTPFKREAMNRDRACWLSPEPYFPFLPPPLRAAPKCPACSLNPSPSTPPAHLLQERYEHFVLRDDAHRGVPLQRRRLGWRDSLPGALAVGVGVEGVQDTALGPRLAAGSVERGPAAQLRAACPAAWHQAFHADPHRQPSCRWGPAPLVCSAPASSPSAHLLCSACIHTQRSSLDSARSVSVEVPLCT